MYFFQLALWTRWSMHAEELGIFSSSEFREAERPGSLADVGWAGIESGLRAESTLLQYPSLVLKGPSGIQECP